jgi:hypothetical protein
VIESLTQPIPVAVIIFPAANVPIQVMLWWFLRRQRRESAEETFVSWSPFFTRKQQRARA